MDRRRVIWTTLLTLVVLTACLGIIFFTELPQIIQDGMILPIVFNLWLLGLLIRSLDQEVVWVFALVVLGGIFAYLLSRGWLIRLPSRAPKPVGEEEPGSVHWRVRFWHARLSTLKDQGIGSKYASFEFRLLSRQVVALSQGFPESGGRLPEHVPEEVIRQAPETIQPLLSRNGLESFEDSQSQGRIRRFFHPSRLRSTSNTPATSDALNYLCDYLEEQLEIKDELNH